MLKKEVLCLHICDLKLIHPQLMAVKVPMNCRNRVGIANGLKRRTLSFNCSLNLYELDLRSKTKVF